MTKRAIICLVAGVVASLAWTPLETWLIWLITPTTYWAFHITQVVVGFAVGVVLTLPVVLLLAPISTQNGLLFSAAFVLSVLAGTLVAGGTIENIQATFRLPDFYAFIAAVGACFLWASRASGQTSAAQPGVQADRP